jgi:curved DNA-binding protein CbpA
MKDYYYILGIKPNATTAEIKKAYRKLSIKFHPDKNDGDEFFEERFKEINEAHETLVNEDRRKIYDYTHSFNNNAYTKKENRDDFHERNEDFADKQQPRKEAEDDGWDSVHNTSSNSKSSRTGGGSFLVGPFFGAGVGFFITVFIAFFKGCGLFHFDPQDGGAYLLAFMMQRRVFGSYQ